MVAVGLSKCQNAIYCFDSVLIYNIIYNLPFGSSFLFKVSVGLYSSIPTVSAGTWVFDFINEPIRGGGGGCGSPAATAGFIFILAKICDKFDGIDILAKTLEVAEVAAKAYQFQEKRTPCLLTEIEDKTSNFNLPLVRL